MERFKDRTRKDFNVKVVNKDKYLPAEIKSNENEVKTNFHDKDHHRKNSMSEIFSNT